VSYILFSFLLAILFFLLSCSKFLKFPIKDIFKIVLISPSFLIWVFVIIYCYIGFELYWKGNYLYLEKNYEHSLQITSIILILFFLIFAFTEFIAYFLIKINVPKNIIFTNRITFLSFLNIYTFVILAIFIIFLPNSDGMGVLNFLFNSLIPIIVFGVLNKDKKFYIYFFTFLFISFYAEFRYRFILIFIPIILYLFISQKFFSKKILNILILSILSLTLVAFLGSFRKYNSYLDIENYTNFNFFEMIILGLFNDTSTVLVTGKFIEKFNEIGVFAHFYQLKYIYNYLVPSILLEEKAYSPVLSYIYTLVGSDEAGSAILAIGEYYHTGGIIGLAFFAIVYSFFLTYFYKKYIRFNINFYLISYLMYVTWFINSFTRGYIPQNIADLIAIIIGLCIVKISIIKTN